VKYLLGMDHISILQRQAGAEYATLLMRLAQYLPTDLACSIISFHEQILGCHTYVVLDHALVHNGLHLSSTLHPVGQSTGSRHGRRCICHR
jgi:hypothetical protein